MNASNLITRPRELPPVLVLDTREAVIEVDILDHDGALVCTRSKRAFDCAGAACIEIATVYYTVRVENGRPCVRLRWGDLSGLRITKTARYWLGVD